MRNLAPLALLIALPLSAQRIDGVPHAAAVTEMARATLDELASAAVAPPLARHDERPRPMPAAKRIAGDAIVAELVTVAAAAPAPAVARGFRSSSDPLPGTTVGVEPADASGAVGPHHVVGAFNNSLAVHDRDGNQLSILPATQFWHDPAFADLSLYDPRVMYDAVNDRWVLAMLGDTNLRLGTLLVAVSTSGDPTGAWRRFRIAASTNPAVALDFTRMAMTSGQIVITANEYDGDAPGGADVFTIAKSAAYSDTAVSSAVRTHSAFDFDLTPVTSSDSRVRILTQDLDTVVQYELVLGHLAGVGNYSPPVSFSLGPSDASQLGSAKKVDCGTSMLHHALFRDGVLWIVQKAVDGERSEIVIWKIAGTSAKVFVIEDPVADYAYPSLAVNRFGAALVGYSILSGSIYPSAACRYIDPQGNVSAPAVVKDGEDWYVFVRWGDYSTTLVDPVDDTSFWTLQSYATPPFRTSHVTWGTWWSYVKVQPPQRVRAVRH